MIANCTNLFLADLFDDVGINGPTISISQNLNGGPGRSDISNEVESINLNIVGFDAENVTESGSYDTGFT